MSVFQSRWRSAPGSRRVLTTSVPPTIDCACSGDFAITVSLLYTIDFLVRHATGIETHHLWNWTVTQLLFAFSSAERVVTLGIVIPS